MGFFTVGNIITLVIVVLILVLYRQMDRNSRTLKLLRDYSERLKKDLNVFVKEQEKAVKDYSISLNVEKDAAKELMKRLQISEEELARKAQSMSKIEGQIKAYENSLAELEKMTSRVQENMNRVRDESAFVDTTGRRISEVKDKLFEFEKGQTALVSRFEKENTEALAKAVEKTLAAVKTTVSNLGATAERIKTQAEEHRHAINKMEEARAANIARDTEFINKILSRAVEQAGKRADKMEEAALANLKEQAEDRIRKLKTAEEERLRGYQESAKERVAEVQNMVKTLREEWRADKDERRKEIDELGATLEASKSQIEEFSARTNEIVSAQEANLLKTAEEMKQKALEVSGEKLEEYRRVQDMEFRRLETLTDDSRKLDTELRRYMQDVIDRLKDDFAVYEKESADLQKIEADKFAAAASLLKGDMTQLEDGLAALKSSAYENVSSKLKAFEDEFFSDLTRRGTDIDLRLVKWQEGLEERLSLIGEEAENQRRNLEHGLQETIQANYNTQDSRLVSSLEHLKAETLAFEDAIRGQMDAADDSVSSCREQFNRALEETRKEAEITIKTEVGKHSLLAMETVKQYQRELDSAQDGIEARLRELDGNVEDTRRRVRELSTETDSRIAAVRGSVEEAERHISEAIDQTALVDKAKELALNMERRIEDLKGDMDRLDQRRAELAQIENDFIKIKRLEDDVNSKMTRFLSEQRRIDTMEAGFNRLIQVSHSVEEKLTQVSSSDDILSGVQVQIRKLEEALGANEEKFQRIERKNQILDNTNDGIDRNFKELQESEKLSAKIDGNLDRYSEDLSLIKTSIEKLAVESDKARDAVDRIDVLNNALEEIEERIKSMQRARQSLAELETRFEELNRQARAQANAIDLMMKGKKSGVTAGLGEGAPTPQKKENVIALARQGWKIDEIAKNMKISRGEVELILEMAPKDI